MHIDMVYGWFYAKIWYNDQLVFIRGAQIINWMYFEQMIVKSEHPIWAKLGAFHQKWYTDGWVIEQKIDMEIDFWGVAGKFMHNFAKVTPSYNRVCIITQSLVIECAWF